MHDAHDVQAVNLTFRALLPLQQVAKIIGAQSKDVVFTSGATESNNMIIKGIAKFYGSKRNHIITTQTVSDNRPCCPYSR